MKNKTAHITVMLLLAVSLSACTQSSLNPNQTGASATLGIFLPNFASEMEDIRVSTEALSQLLPALTKARHHKRKGSPHPQMKYVLTIKQKDISEQFYFFDDLSPCSFTLPSSEEGTVVNIVKDLIKKENANQKVDSISKDANTRL